VPDGTPAARAERTRELAAGVLTTGSEDYMALATLLSDLADVGVALGIDDCDRADWRPDLLQCIPADDFNMATFFVPDFVERAFNAEVVDGEVTEWCMGAVGSAVRFVAE
jgi:hypothetical protein